MTTRRGAWSSPAARPGWPSTAPASRSIPELFRARFERPVPQVSEHGGVVAVRHPRFSPGAWRPWARRRGEVTLNQDVAWTISTRRGVAHLDASHVRITTE